MFACITSWRCCSCPIKIIKAYTQDGSEMFYSIKFYCPKCGCYSSQNAIEAKKAIVVTRELVEFICELN